MHVLRRPPHLLPAGVVVNVVRPEGWTQELTERLRRELARYP